MNKAIEIRELSLSIDGRSILNNICSANVYEITNVTKMNIMDLINLDLNSTK